MLENALYILGAIVICLTVLVFIVALYGIFNQKKETEMDIVCEKCGAEWSSPAFQNGEWRQESGRWVHKCPQPGATPISNLPPQDPSTLEIDDSVTRHREHRESVEDSPVQVARTYNPPTPVNNSTALSLDLEVVREVKLPVRLGDAEEEERITLRLQHGTEKAIVEFRSPNGDVTYIELRYLAAGLQALTS